MVKSVRGVGRLLMILQWRRRFSFEVGTFSNCALMSRPFLLSTQAEGRAASAQLR